MVPPVGWPLTAPADVLLGSADRARWSGQGWWWPAVIAALALVALLALWWLLAQLRRRHPGALPVGGTPPQQGVELRDRALGDAIATEASALPAVEHAAVRISNLSVCWFARPWRRGDRGRCGSGPGRPAHPHTRVALTLTPQASPGTLLDALCEGPLRTARRSTGSPHMPTEVRLQVAGHKPHRAE
ncbi:alkaline shock response membrane anchor protein AmaP [Streptomyces sp. NPDC002088]|uniref:alkaline shock response membrane anchor protein AmaP n=1 Tax=Streptomyces sp. NPDC002088 TaxID=3154665 RepID=UPI00331E3E3E